MSSISRNTVPVLLVAVTGLGLWMGRPTMAPGQTKRGCAAQQLKVTAGHSAAGMEGSWRLTINENGAADLTSVDKDHRFQLSEDACVELVDSLKRERFFDLRNTYGVSMIDGTFRELNITLGKKQHSVILYDDLSKDPDPTAVKRALRVWIAVRGLFSIPGAADSRKEDQALLKH